ncbi:hypothetical protein Bpfe_022933, partial [Biomphalaria pfeifferi]
MESFLFLHLTPRWSPSYSYNLPLDRVLPILTTRPSMESFLFLQLAPRWSPSYSYNSPLDGVLPIPTTRPSMESFLFLQLHSTNLEKAVIAC